MSLAWATLHSPPLKSTVLIIPRRLFSLVLLLTVSVNVNAYQARCDALQLAEKKLNATSVNWLEVHELLAGASNVECFSSDVFYALWGQSKLRLGYIEESIIALEKAILLNPNNIEAQVDFSDALFVAGQTLAAKELNQNLITRSSMPESLRQHLLQREKQLNDQLTQLSSIVSVGAFWDSNINNGVEFDNVRNSLPIFWPMLSAEYLREEGWGAFLHANVKAIHKMHFGHLYGKVERYDFVGLGNDEDLARTAFTFGVNLDSGNRYPLTTEVEYAILEKQRERNWSIIQIATDIHNSELAGFAEVNSKYYFSLQNNELNSDLDATEFGGIWAIQDAEKVIPGQIRINVNFNKSSSGLRPGGDRKLLGLAYRLGVDLPLGKLDLELELDRSLDSENYSELIGLNEKRRINKKSINLNYIYNINPYAALVVSTSYRQQSSNVKLFDREGFGVQISLSRQF